MGNILSPTSTPLELARFSGHRKVESFLTVTELNLRGKRVIVLPNSIGQLTNLQSLDLSRNQLSSLPESIGQLTNLTGLSLHMNLLSSLPESIGLLTNMTAISLYINQLSSLPESIGQLTNMTAISLHINQLSSLPESIGQLTNLMGLWLDRNQLSSLPESMGQLTNLQQLYLDSNHLSFLPESIGWLTNLMILSLFENPITELPEFITRLKNMKRLQIQSKGKMTIQRAPIGITALPCYSNDKFIDRDMMITYSEVLKKLKLYKYYNENLTDISSLIGKWRACGCINISNNEISTLPDQLSILTYLCDFNLAHNMFDRFPDVLLKMSWLTSLNIAGNSFTELPEGISKLVKLSEIVIKDSSGDRTIQRAPIWVKFLPCFKNNVDLKKLMLYDPAREAAPVVADVPTAVRTPIVNFPSELQQLVLSVAPTFNITEADKLGKGGQATVYKGMFEGKPVAIKDIIKPDIENIKYAADEVILTKKIPHQNIVNIIGVYLSPKGMWIVMELGSDSLKGMIDQKKGPLTAIEIVTYGKQIADALNYCVTHNPREPIHHRDLKTENVLIVNGQAKLADFRLAHASHHNGESTPHQKKDGDGYQAGSYHWQGPEIHHTFNSHASTDESKEVIETFGHRGELSDVFAFGLILWSMATGEYPFYGRFPGQIPHILLNGERPKIPADVHPTLAHLIRSCWRQNYKLRPRFSCLVPVLTICGAGNLDAVSKETLDHLIPIRYSPMTDMFYGELFQYLTEHGIPQHIALKIRAKQMNGELFSSYTARKFMDNFQISEAEAQKLVSLQTPTLDLHPNDTDQDLGVVDLKHFSMMELKSATLIGSGGFGDVYRVDLKSKIVAVKVHRIRPANRSDELMKIQREAELLSNLHHTNITRLLWHGQHMDGAIIYVMEFAEQGSLADILKKSPLNDQQFFSYAQDIIRGLLYLHTHSPPITHRDMKPENVLIVGNVAKLADFGTASSREMASKSTGLIGTPIWSPPEAFHGRFPGPPGDIYAFGLILWTMLTNLTPYSGLGFELIMLAKLHNQTPSIPSDCLPELADSISKCWQTDSLQRPKASTLETYFETILKVKIIQTTSETQIDKV